MLLDLCILDYNYGFAYNKKLPSLNLIVLISSQLSSEYNESNEIRKLLSLQIIRWPVG